MTCTIEGEARLPGSEEEGCGEGEPRAGPRRGESSACVGVDVPADVGVV